MESKFFIAISAKTKKVYYLHSRLQTLKGERQQMLYFFAQTVKKDGSGTPLTALPEGYQVGENTKTGLPILKKARPDLSSY